MFHFGLVAIAVVFGALLPYVVDPASQVVVIIAAIVICLVLWFAPTKLLRAAPRFATWLYQGGYVLVFVIIAASTAFASWLAFAVPGWLASVPEAQQSHVSGVVVGALNALIGALVAGCGQESRKQTLAAGAAKGTSLRRIFRCG